MLKSIPVILTAVAAGVLSAVPISIQASQRLQHELGNLRTLSIVRSYAIDRRLTPINFKVTAGAICEFERDPAARPYRFVADASGFVNFSVGIPSGSDSLVQPFICSDAHSKYRVSVSYRRSTAAGLHLSSNRQSLPQINQATMDQFVLANGFDPRTVSNAVLMEHGLPPRPDDFATNPQASIGWLEAAFTPNTSVSNVSVPVPDAYAGNTTSFATNNWSGYNAGGVAGTWNTVRGYWTVPTGYNTNYGSATYSAIWVGIDGGYCGASNGQCSPANVFQDGTETDVVIMKGAYYDATFGWWEEYPYNSQQQALSVSPGDQMYGTFYKNIQNNIVYGQYYLKDLTSGAVYQSAQNVGANLSGDSVEWIVEAPKENGNRAPLADYSTAQMTQASAVSGSTTFTYDQIPQQTTYTLTNITMDNLPNTQVDSTTTGNGNGSISWNWYNSN